MNYLMLALFKFYICISPVLWLQIEVCFIYKTRCLQKDNRQQWLYFSNVRWYQLLLLKRPINYCIYFHLSFCIVFLHRYKPVILINTYRILAQYLKIYLTMQFLLDNKLCTQDLGLNTRQHYFFIFRFSHVAKILVNLLF